MSRVEQPGGSTRRSLRAFLDDPPASVIVTRRRHAERARLEAAVLSGLSRHGAPVPRLLACDGEWLVQEDLGVERLTRALAAADEAGGGALLASALSALAAIQSSARAAGLHERVVRIGHRTDWLAKFVETPERLGHLLGIPAPALDKAALIDALRPAHATFIKWDARPGNAVVRADGSIAWFDWEHCGVRNALDDMAWLLCDEYTPDWPATERRLVDIFLPIIGRTMTIEAARDYLFTIGTFHSCVRLSLILNKKSSGPWWDPAWCLETDSVGVTLEAAQRTFQRAKRWASSNSQTAALGDWFAAVAEKTCIGPPS